MFDMVQVTQDHDPSLTLIFFFIFFYFFSHALKHRRTFKWTLLKRQVASWRHQQALSTSQPCWQLVTSGLGMGLGAPSPFHSAKDQHQLNLESEELGLCGPFMQQRRGPGGPKSQWDEHGKGDVNATRQTGLVDALPSDQADGKRGRLLALKRESPLPETTWQLHKQQTHKKQCVVLQ